MTWRADATCVRQADLHLTYAQVWERSGKAACLLRSLGLEEGDRVAYLDVNDFRYVEILLAVARTGLILVPINNRLKADEIRYILEDTGARAVLSGDRYYGTVQEAARGLHVAGLVALRDAVPAGWLSYADWMASSAEVDAEYDSLADAPAAILYTSGTTGFPKGSVHTHASLMAQAWRMIQCVGLCDDDVSFVVTPLFHMSGLNMVVPTLVVGGAVAIGESFDAARLTEHLAQSGATFTLLVPAMIRLAIAQPAMCPMPRLRMVMYGGSPMNIENLLAAQRYFSSDFIQCYGMTEAAVLTVLDRAHHRAPGGGEPPKLRSVGHPLPGCCVAIRRPDGSFTGSGEPGEICARGDVRTGGYWGRPEATAELLAGGWLATGDIGYLDDDGFLYVVDRLKDMIIRNGENIYPAEVERVLGGYPGLSEVAVFGVPHEEWGEQVVAQVVAAPGASVGSAEVLAYLRQRIAGYKVPTDIAVVGELPKNATGKVLKRELRRAWPR